MLRKFIQKFNKSVAKRVNLRRELNVPIAISIVPDRETSRLQMPVPKQIINGETLDLSETGILFSVSAIRLGGYYLAGEGRTLKAEISLPNGKIEMHIIGTRYEQQLDIHSSVTQFHIGARIVSMSEENRAVYNNFIKHGGKSNGEIFQLNPEKS